MKNRQIDVAVCLSLFAVALAIGLVRAALKPRPHTPEEFGLTYEVGAVDMNGNGLDDYTDLLLGARRDAENRPMTGYSQMTLFADGELVEQKNRYL